MVIGVALFTFLPVVTVNVIARPIGATIVSSLDDSTTVDAATEDRVTPGVSVASDALDTVSPVAKRLSKDTK